MEDKQYIGHRLRLKERILNAAPEDLADYELIEILLFFAIPRKDVKPLAKKLLREFGGISNLLHVDINKFLSVEGTTRNIYTLFVLMRELSRRSLRNNITGLNIISSWSALLDYLKFSTGSSKVEQCRVLFLNKKNVLIADDVMGIGTIDEIFVHPREIVKKALLHDAASIILVHNHPSNSIKPSKADIEVTKKIVVACEAVNINVHDHVIVSSTEYFSFKSNMLL